VLAQRFLPPGPGILASATVPLQVSHGRRQRVKKPDNRVSSDTDSGCEEFRDMKFVFHNQPATLRVNKETHSKAAEDARIARKIRAIFVSEKMDGRISMKTKRKVGTLLVAVALLFGFAVTSA
jgi:hypothetical protein